MSTSSLYLDGAASTPLDPAVAANMAKVAPTTPGNPSAVHRAGVAASRRVEKARATLAAHLDVSLDAVIFTGSGTEANNLALLGTARHAGKGHLVLSAVEHPSVHEPALWLSRHGFELTLVPVDGDGRVDPDDVAAALRPDTILVSVMHANNETGTVQPVAAIGAICRARGVRFHVDACQSLGKLPVRPRTMGADLVTVNAHKLHGPRGVGALYVGSGVALEPLVFGGGQERGLRSGTHNTEGIAGFGWALERADEEQTGRLAGLRRHLLGRLLDRFPHMRMVGGGDESLPSILAVRFPGHPAKKIARALSRKGISVSTGSACNAGADTPSRVLLAMGHSEEEAREMVRFGLHRFLTRADLDAVTDALGTIIGKEPHP
jgi:cysteine desulfurase